MACKHILSTIYKCPVHDHLSKYFRRWEILSNKPCVCVFLPVGWGWSKHTEEQSHAASWWIREQSSLNTVQIWLKQQLLTYKHSYQLLHVDKWMGMCVWHLCMCGMCHLSFRMWSLPPWTSGCCRTGYFLILGKSCLGVAVTEKEKNPHFQETPSSGVVTKYVFKVTKNSNRSKVLTLITFD